MKNNHLAVCLLGAAVLAFASSCNNSSNENKDVSSNFVQPSTTVTTTTSTPEPSAEPQVSESERRLKEAYETGKKHGYSNQFGWHWQKDVYVNRYGVPETVEERNLFHDYELEYKKGYNKGLEMNGGSGIPY